MTELSIIIALLIGYYLGTKREPKETIEGIKARLQELKHIETPNRLKVLHKKEPLIKEEEVTEELDAHFQTKS